MRSNFGRFSYPLRIKGLWQILWSKNGQFLPKIAKLSGGSRKYPLNVLKSKGNFRVLSQMASDSEGLRLSLFWFSLFKKVANGFRFGRVTTYSSNVRVPVSQSQMASDSEGLRRCNSFIKAYPTSVANGFRFGRVTTLSSDIQIQVNKSQMASDSEGLRRNPHTFTNSWLSSRKWLPIRKGYDWICVASGAVWK